MLRLNSYILIHTTERQQHSDFDRLRVQVMHKQKSTHERHEENASQKSPVGAFFWNPTHGSTPSAQASEQGRLFSILAYIILSHRGRLACHLQNEMQIILKMIPRDITTPHK